MSDEQSKVLTLVFTDLADSTALKTERGDSVVREMIARHREHVTQLAAECSGRIVDWAGDGCFLTFDTSSAAVMFGLRLQEAHAQENDLPGVRVGLHMGEVSESVGPQGEDGPPRIEGLAVDLAARVSSVAKQGQVLMSSAVYDSARQRLGVEAFGQPILWQAHGTYALKGFDKPLEIGEAGLEGMAPLEAPKAGEKARLVKRAPKNLAKTRGGFESHRIPVWALVVGALAMLAFGAGLNSIFNGETRGTTSSDSDAPIRSLAVLPFENFSGDASQEYRVDGMTDTLTAELAKIGSITVKARTSAMRYKNTEKPFEQIARELGVDGLIEGSIQQSGNDVVITAQLVDGRTNNHVWAENFEGTLENILRLQGEVAVAIAREIDAVLTPEERARYDQAKTVNPDAWDLYLRARDAWRTRTNRGFDDAIQLLERSIAVDSQFADAHALLSLVYMSRPFNVNQPIVTDLENAESTARRALELDPRAIEAHYALAWSANVGRTERAVGSRHLATAQEIDPDDPYGLFVQTAYMNWSGDLVGRPPLLKRAIELDPQYPLYRFQLVQTLWQDERYQEALTVADDLDALQADFRLLDALLVRIYLDSGDSARALDAVTQIQSDVDQSYLKAYVLARTGRREEATKLLDEASPQDHLDTTQDRARALIALGRIDEALLTLVQSDAAGFGAGFILPSTDLGWRPVWDVPRYWEVLHRIGTPTYPPEHPAYEYQQKWLRTKAAEELLAKQPVERLSVTLPPGEYLSMSTARGARPFALSPDGSMLVYGSTGEDRVSRLTIRPFSELVGRTIQGTENAFYPFFSPDGMWVAYGDFREGKLKKVAVAGGTSMDICDLPGDRLEGNWGEDGFIVFASTFGSGLYRVPDTGGQAESLTTLPTNEMSHSNPSVFGNGANVLFSGYDGLRWTERWIGLHRSGEQTSSRLMNAAGFPTFVAPGHLVYALENGLAAVPFNVDQLAVMGTPVSVTEVEMARTGRTGSHAFYDVSANGSLAYVRGATSAVGAGSFVWVQRNGEESFLDSSPAAYETPFISPDGTRVAYRVLGDTYVYDFERTTTSRVTTHPSLDLGSVWSPDGKILAFYSVRDEGPGIYQKSSDGTGSAELLFMTGRLAVPTSWTSDGNSIIYFDFGLSRDLHMITLEDGSPVSQTLLDSEFDEQLGHVSPDGNWIAYQSDESGIHEVYVRSFPQMTEKQIVSTNGGYDPRWSGEGDEIFYRNDDAVMAVSVETTSSLTLGTPEPLFDDTFESPGSTIKGGPPAYDVTNDGRFLMIQPYGGGPARFNEIVVVKNWINELNRLVPLSEVK